VKREWEVVLHKRETIVRRKKRGGKNVCVETLYIYLLCYLKVFFSLLSSEPILWPFQVQPSPPNLVVYNVA